MERAVLSRRATAAMAFALLAGVWLGPAPVALAEDVPSDASVQLRLLHINDVYEISPSADGWGGMAPLMTLLEEERKGATHHLTTLGGDLLSPSILSSTTRGAQMIDLTNAIGVNVAVLGNHEFDFGTQVLEERVAESRYKWLATNVLAPDGAPWAGAEATCLLTFGPFKVGLFGVLTPETEELANVDPLTRITDPVTVARESVKQLRARGADVVIALTHLSMHEDLDLAARVDGIDVMLGGHDHEARTFFDGSTLIHKSGHDGHYLGVIDLTIAREDGKIRVRPQWRMRQVFGVKHHPEVAAIVERYEGTLRKELAVDIGTTSVDLDGREETARRKEAAVANLVADAMRAITGTDVALFNGGGIRGDRVIPAGSTLQRGDIVAMLPFADVVMVVDVTGAVLRAALEHGLSRLDTNAGRFPQVSGIEVVVDSSKPVGMRITKMKVAGRSVKHKKIYRVAVGSFVAKGGDGYRMLLDGKRIVDANTGHLLTTAVIEYVRKHTPVAPKLERRIVIK